MKRPLCIVMLMLAVLLGLLLLIIPMEEHLCVPDRVQVTKIGIVSSKEKKNDSYVVYLKVPKEYGRIMLYLADNQKAPEIGTVIKVCGKCAEFPSATNPGEFDSKSYYRILKIPYKLTDVKILDKQGKADYYKELLFSLKMKFEKRLEKCMPEKDSGVMEAILLGDKNNLDDDIKEAYKRNGIIHIIAVSGLHISIIGLGLYKLLRRMSLHTVIAALISATVMYSYGIMCGMSTSAFRAIFMFMVKVFADVIGRTYDMLSAMSLCAILVLLEQPLYLKHSGFLMSFGAIIALGYVLPALPRSLRKKPFNIFSASMAIFLVNLPVYTTFYFTFPVYSAFLNILILPIMSVLIFLGIAVLILGFVFLPLANILSLGVHIILSWFMICCNMGQGLYGNTWYIGHSENIQVFVYLICLFGFIFFNEYRINPLHKRIKNLPANVRKLTCFSRYILILAGITVLCIRPKDDLKITFLDVGQGDGIVIESKDGNYLIDGGSTSKKELGKYQLIPFLSYEGIGKLDAVILTHEDEDHLSGITELFEEMGKSRGCIKIGNLILPDVDEKTKGDNYRKLEHYAHKYNVPVSYIGRGDEIKNNRVYMKCIGPVSKMKTDEPNAYSTIMFLELGEFRALFTGDVEGKGQENLKEYIRKEGGKYKDITLLKVAHHGSRNTTDKEFLEMIKPRIAVISCGVNNRYNHPHKELVERLEDIGAGIYSTALEGAVTVKTNGKTMNIYGFVK